MVTTLTLRSSRLAAVLIFFSTFIQGQSVIGFTLINAVSDTAITPLQDGDTLVLNELPALINIRAETAPDTVGSVIFDFNGTLGFRTENIKPYELFTHNAADSTLWAPQAGSYLLIATAYDSISGQGQAGLPFAITFHIIAADTTGGGGDDCYQPGDNSVDVSGELKKWHRITLDFHGPYAYEKCTPNPFLDYRLEVVFHHPDSNRTYRVPGFFAADGNAAETSASDGHIWRCYFAPDLEGNWTYVASFRKGTDVAVSNDPQAGSPTAFNGLAGAFLVGPTNKTGRDNRAHGRLNYVGKRYLQYSETGAFFLKAGADSPETFLAYQDFDSTLTYATPLKSWEPHIPDWQNGDPSWQNGKGKGMIGAINYLAAKAQNAIAFLTFNVMGDGQNVWPYVLPDNFTRFDVSKLDQWEIVFDHADKKGMHLNFKLQEQENDQLHDNGDVGRLRKLYFREMIARFGHHLAMSWNLGEENSQTTDQRVAMTNYFAAHDPYQHLIVIHNGTPFDDLLGNASSLTGVSFQSPWMNVHGNTRHWVRMSEENNKPWVVSNDEQGPSTSGVPPDIGYPGNNHSGYTQDDIRKSVLWGNLMAGGAGVEYYFGYNLPQTDIDLEDYRSREQMWDYNAIALDFFRQYLPFWNMDNHNGLVGAPGNSNQKFCFALPGEIYAIFLPKGGTTNLDLQIYTDSLEVRWFNPREGGELLLGTTGWVQGPGTVNIGNPPLDDDQDWVALIQKPKAIPTSTTTPQTSQWKLYPNPARDVLHLEPQNLLPGGNLQLIIYDELGRSRKEHAFHSQSDLTIPLDLPAGVYFLHLLLDNQVVGREKLVVEWWRGEWWRGEWWSREWWSGE